MHNIVLTISLLVSNRIDTIRKCMESIRPILEQLPSELIAVDTVGENTDGSIEIVKEYTDKIYPFTWCNDFSAARNEGLKRAQGQWFMFMDDDEWFEDVSEIIEFFQSGEYKKYNSASYKIHDYNNRQGAYTVATLKRMVKMEKDTAFHGAVHEYLAPMYSPCKEFQSYIHHYGYVFDTEEEHEKHCERNLSLLRPEFEKNPNDMHLRVQMVQECMFLKRLEPEAIRLCEDTMKLGKEYWIRPEFQWIITAYVRLAGRNKEWESVLERAEHIRKRFAISPFTNTAISTMELLACKKLEQYELTGKLLENLEKSIDFLNKNPEKKQAQNMLDFDVFIEDSVLANAYADGIIALHKSGQQKEAAKWAAKRREYLKKPMLSISLLVSNNKSTIQKCMESLLPLQKQLGAEIIVVDTVGEKKSDGSLQIAKAYADKLVHFDWCDDFAAARNAGLSQVEGEWFLYLDDDEWFEDTSEIIEFFRTGEYLCYNSGTYEIHNYKDKKGSSYSTAVLARMVKRTNNTRFIGSVHETFQELLLPCKDFGAYVHHYGYAYESEEEKMGHLSRNVSLLKKELEKNPLNLRYRAQMAMELATHDNEAALAFCEETFRLCPEKKKENDFQWQLSLVFRLYEALGTDSTTAEESYTQLKKQFGFSETTENGICYQMVRIHLLKGTTEKAYPYAEKYFKTLQFLKANKELQQKQMTADFQRYQTKEAYWEMLHYGAYSASMAGIYVTAWEWYEKMPWEQKEFKNAEAFTLTLQLFDTYPDMKRMTEILKRITKNTSMMKMDSVRKLVGDVLTNIKEGKALVNTGGPTYIKSDIKLSIGVLVSNNIGTIRKCMDSLKPILESVKSELIVVDTKGEETDGSFAIAKEYADKTYYFKWCNDFAAARNVCMDHAEGEWFLFVDDDEWFEDTAEIIEFFNSGECNNYGQGLYNIRNYYNNAGSYVEAMVGRFIHRTPNTRFVGRVHETFSEHFPPNKFFQVYAHHSGYTYQNEEEKKQHQNRNLTLLKAQLEEEGYSPSVCSQMVQELLCVRDTWKEGYEFSMKCLPILVDELGMMDNSNTQWVMVASARYFDSLGDEEGFKKQVAYLRETYKLSQVAELFLAAIETSYAMRNYDYEACEKHVQHYLELWDWLQQHPDVAITQNQLDFAMQYNEQTYFRMVHIGGKCANMQKKYQVANQYWKRLPWEKEGFNKVVYWNDMQETIQGLKEMRRQSLSPEMQKLVEQLKQNIRVLIAAGDVKTARELLQGLEEVVPWDEDIIDWKNVM